MSIGSKPAFSAKVLGIISTESANAWTASCSLPDKLSENFLKFLASSISGEPAPATTLLFFKAAETSPIASSTARLTSSITCSVAPLTKRVTALGFLHSFTIVISSSPILVSSTMPALPKSAADKSSKLVIILAPVALERPSISLFLTLLEA